MLQASFIRQYPDEVKQRLAKKNFHSPELVDEWIELDEKRRKLQSGKENIQALIKTASREVGDLMKSGQKDEAEKKKAEVATLKEKFDDVSELNAIEARLQEVMVQFPNLPAPEVPEGKTPEDNVTVRQGGSMPSLAADAVPHWDLVKKYSLIDFELGNKITGSGFPFYTGQGARLQRALIQYFLDFNTSAGYVEYMPPLVVNADSAFGTGQLPDKEGQMYFVTEDKFYLIPTAEVPVTNIYRDEIVKETALPIKMTAYTPCFRREAGSYGKDVRGLNRLHQFDKVEIVQMIQPEKSYEALDEMVKHVERLVLSLGLPYRILRLCGGDMGFAAAITYDFEVYSAAQQKWLEVSSVSNFESFQSNRMKIRYKDADGKMQLVHTLNGSSLALPRILACLLENNQSEKGIAIPEVLVKYFGKESIA
jgi:seryl-tRNA synthetase